MLKVMIVDDEPLARDELGYLLKRTKKVEITCEAMGLNEAIRDLESNKVDVIFVDIQLAEDSGLVLARKINQMEDPPEIVFATAYDEFALEAFELNAVDYILKPFDEDRVHQTIEKLVKKTSHSKERIRTSSELGNPTLRLNKLALNVNDRILMITIKDILYLYSHDGMTIIVTENDRYQVSESLVSLERKLQNTSIIRVHRSYLVNLDQILEIEPWFNSTYNLKIVDGEKIPVSRTYMKFLKELMGF
jgi:two-component system, LytTR family, response regulator LytT